MIIEIKGDPGAGNSYTEVHIENVQNYNPNATTVINNYGTQVKPQAASKPGVAETNKEDVRSEIVRYVAKTLNLVSEEWRKKYMPLWEDILKLKAVDVEVYNPGGQQGTLFNRVLVAGIIRILKDHGVYVANCTNTALAIALENDYDHHVRQEIGKYPSDEIRTAVEHFLINQ